MAMSSEEAEKESTNSGLNDDDETYVTGSMVKSSSIKKLKMFDFITKDRKHIHLIEEQINQQKKIKEEAKAKATKHEGEVVKAYPNRIGKGWKTIYGQIQTRMDYLHTTEAELGINLYIPLNEHDSLEKLNDLANKKRKHADDIHDYFKANKRLKSSVQYEDHIPGTGLNELVLGMIMFNSYHRQDFVTIEDLKVFSYTMLYTVQEIFFRRHQGPGQDYYARTFAPFCLLKFQGFNSYPSSYVELYDKHGGSFIVNGHRVKLYHDEEQLNEMSSKENMLISRDVLLYYDVEMELMNLILLSIPNDIYNFVDACTSAKDMWKRFVAEPGEALVLVYNRFAQLMNNLERNDMHFLIVTINTKFLNYLQPEWLKYVTQLRLAKRLTVDTFDDLFYYLQQFKKQVNVSRAKKLEKSHDPLALVAHTGSSSRNTSSYYEDKYQQVLQDDVHTNSEDPLTSAMLVNIQSRNSGNAGRNNRRAYVQEEIVEGSNAPNDTGNVQRTLRTSSS
ncbi:hypothetical protein Tco_1180136 [Tanacetum coccineum]